MIPSPITVTTPPAPAASPPARTRAVERPGSPLIWAALLGGAALLALVRRGLPLSPQGIRTRAARRLNAGASTLAFSVLADSTLEHYRASFHNRAMYIAPVASALTLGTAASAAARPGAGRASRAGIFVLAALTGLIGFGFHLANITRREGGWSWQNLFYGAPVAAPLGIHLAGLLGLAGSHVAAVRGTATARLLALPAGRALALGVAGGLVGTAAEAALLHFRGAFHNPYMWLPAALPPATAVALTAVAMGGPRGPARALLGATTLLGFLGVGFHAYGVSRNMGGWRNWSQNLQNGPPLPAPPSFTGLALAGLGALDLLDAEVPA